MAVMIGAGAKEELCATTWSKGERQDRRVAAGLHDDPKRDSPDRCARHGQAALCGERSLRVESESRRLRDPRLRRRRGDAEGRGRGARARDHRRRRFDGHFGLDASGPRTLRRRRPALRLLHRARHASARGDRPEDPDRRPLGRRSWRTGTNWPGRPSTGSWPPRRRRATRRRSSSGPSTSTPGPTSRPRRVHG